MIEIFCAHNQTNLKTVISVFFKYTQTNPVLLFYPTCRVPLEVDSN